MKITYLDGLKFEMESRGLKLLVDQPFPAGENAGMMPVELLSGSLGTCIGVYVIDYLLRHELPTEGVTIDVDMAGAEHPHRIGKFAVKVNIPYELTDRQRVTLDRVAKGCTVHATLHHPPEIDIQLVEGK